MSAPRKKWDAHSERWKREQSKKGLTRAKWDAWFKLSAKSKAVADPYKYAQGVSVADQRRTSAEKAALDNMLTHHRAGREATMLLGIKAMTAKELRWTAKANGAQLRAKASIKMVERERNPWWYR